MSYKGEQLVKVIKEDFGIQRNGRRWFRAIEHDSLVVDYKEGLFYWNSRGICGNIFDYYKFVRRTQPPKILGEAVQITQPLFEIEEKSEANPFPKLVTTFWEMGKVYRDYWYERLLTDGTIDRFKLGYNNGWYTIPVYKDKTLYNIQLRRDEPEKAITQRYRRPSFLFNSSILPYITDSVILTEGIVDAILLNQLGFPAVSKNTGANGWNTGWIQYFINIKKIYLIFDNDSAGRLGARRGSHILGAFRCLVYTFEDFSDKGFDVIDFFRLGKSRKDFSNLLKEAVLVS